LIKRKKSIHLHQTTKDMSKKPINRIKAVLAEKGKTNNWLAAQLEKSVTTTSRWCSNKTQPSVENMIEVAKLLGVDVKDLLHTTKK
jgi:putative transcriptional regulator